MRDARHRHATGRAVAIALLFLSPCAARSEEPAPVPGESPLGELVVVAEGGRVEGLESAPRRVRAELAGRVEAVEGLRRLEAWVRQRWEPISEIDFSALSRLPHDAEATRGWRPPADPELHGEILSVDEDARYHLGLGGPRLPSRYDVVHRHLWVMGIYDPLSGELSHLTLTIRTQVLE